MARALWVGALVALLVVPQGSAGKVWADAPVPGELSIIQLNITGDEFVALQNGGGSPLNLSEYWLGYSSDLALPAVPMQQLPDVQLEAGAVLVLSKHSVATCGASYTDTLDPTLSNTAGRLALWQYSSANQGATFEFRWAVDWDKSVATTPSHLNLKDEANITTYATQHAIDPALPAVWSRSTATPSGWYVGMLNSCVFTPVLSSAVTAPEQPMGWQDSGSGPPFVLGASVSLAPTSLPHIPAADRGLKALDLSEILPNPASPQTDAADEFIELYNPNIKTFDLSGFMLQTASTGSSASHTYHFPIGTTIAPGSFKAFSSATTHLSLSNSGGQVWLVDPLGTTVTTSDAYSNAKDGQAWVNAGGVWQWTTTSTPGSTNKLATPLSGSGQKSSATVNGKKVSNINDKAVSSTTTAAAASSVDGAPTATIHPLTLAVVIAAALLYGAYEYRFDLANIVRQFRRDRANRR